MTERHGSSTDRASPLISDFQLCAEFVALRDRAREFAARELRPHAAAWDRDGRFPAEAVRKAAKEGFLGITIPIEYGGTDLGNLASCVMLEEINAACPSTGVTISVHNSLLCSLIAKAGTEEQKRRYFPKLVTGEWLGAYCLSEAGAGSDAAALLCEATDAGNYYVLNGAKLWITTGTEAGLFVVFARTAPERIKGISAFLVERDFDGVSVGKKERKLGIRASPTVEILLENVEVPRENLLGDLGEGFSLALDTLDGGRLGIAAQSLGIARTSLELIRDHLATQINDKGRPTSPQSAQWAMADIAANLDAYRLLTWRAAVLRDRGVRVTQETAMAKLCASRFANEAARQAVSILGAAGATDASDAERVMRDARICEIYEGVTDIQRIVIARSILG